MERDADQVVRVRAAVVTGFLLLGVAAMNAGNLFYATVHGLGRGGRLYAWFALGAEGGVPTWFSAMLLVAAAAVCALAAVEAGVSRRPFRPHWAGLSAVFVFLSVDEVAQIHERIGGAIRERVDLPRALTAAGVIPGVVLAGIVAVGYWRFVFAQRRQLRLALVLAGAAYVGGAAGVEAFAQAANASHHLGRLGFFLLDTLEENLEMLGIVGFVGAVAWHLEQRGAALGLYFGERGPAGARDDPEGSGAAGRGGGAGPASSR